ncbi:MAG: ASPIC/UnbV domain-containing protein [Saprospiraceae bacterium]
MGDELQMQHLTLSRGFQSSVEPVIHFGLGDKNTVDKITVTWPDGKMQVLENIPANQILKINYEEAVATADGNNMAEKNNYLFTDITADLNIDFQHRKTRIMILPKYYLYRYSKMGLGWQSVM